MQIVASLPQPDQTVTVTASPSAEPSPLPGQVSALNDNLSGLRSMLLFSAGLTIFLLAAISWKVRSNG